MFNVVLVMRQPELQEGHVSSLPIFRAHAPMAVFSVLRMGNTWRGLLAMDLRMLGAMLRRAAGT
jgi:hypothetical protein